MVKTATLYLTLFLTKFNRSVFYQLVSPPGKKMLLSKVKRELSRTSLFGSYRLFWAGCKWQPFLIPNVRVLGFEHATRISIKYLDLKPGVYEFAITKEQPFFGQKKRYKVYVGHSGSIRTRHQKYFKTGDHLLQYFDAALKDGCTIWRRCKYVKTKEKAIYWENKILQKYDYAWNAHHNNRKRKINILLRPLCFCMSSLHVVES